jgi:hypothetical protein
MESVSSWAQQKGSVQKRKLHTYEKVDIFLFKAFEMELFCQNVGCP